MSSAPSFIASYARWRSSRLGQITDALEEQVLLELLGPVERLKLLDAGCGDGVLATKLAQLGARVTGLDPDERMLDGARARARSNSVDLDLVRGRVEALPFPDASFDRVVAVTVLCFVEDADRAVAEMARVLKPGGRLVLGELGKLSLWAAIRRIRGWLGHATWKAAHYRTAGQLRELLERHGLAVDELRGAIFYPPWGVAAALAAGIDKWLGPGMTLGAAFIAASATRWQPSEDHATLTGESVDWKADTRKPEAPTR